MPINFCDSHLKDHKAQVVLWRLTGFINSKCSPSPEISKNSDLVRLLFFFFFQAAFIFVLDDTLTDAIL